LHGKERQVVLQTGCHIESRGAMSSVQKLSSLEMRQMKDNSSFLLEKLQKLFLHQTTSTKREKKVCDRLLLVVILITIYDFMGQCAGDVRFHTSF
jgi:hypothetical protein